MAKSDLTVGNDALKLIIESDREDNGRWIAGMPELPGLLCGGAPQDEAMAKAEALALRGVAGQSAIQK